MSDAASRHRRPHPDEGLFHDVEALADSAFLLTIAWPGRHEERAT